ncbi:MAG: hypothetical protein Q8K64_05755 [Sediminibacterium sp.]|nr:hypothetical protein [Sediminibacterium sp.]
MFFLLLGFTVQGSAQRSKSKKKSSQQKTSSKKKSVGTKKKKKTKQVAVKKRSNNVAASRINKQLDAEEQAAQIYKEGLMDTTGNRVVVITSAFKPSLQNAAKINFSAASAVVDSAKIPLNYKVPSSNLFFSYQPISIQPLALPTDSGWIWQNSHQVKVGAGNFSSVFAEGKFAFGDGKKSITNIEANFLTSKSRVFAQQYSKFGLDVKSILNTAQNLEWTTHAFFNSITQFRYGFNPASLIFTKDQLQQTYNTVALELGLKNTISNDAGVNYHPQLSYYRFTDNTGGSENNLILKAPLEKSLSNIISLQLGLTADIATAIFATTKLTNNLFFINPALVFTTPNLTLNIGVQPSWDNNAYSMQPDISAEAQLKNSRLKLQAGWVGYFNKNTYRSLAGYNPWIGSLNQLANTRIREQYIGLKGIAGNHIAYNARVSFMKMNNQPLFINDGVDGKTFITLFEPDMDALKIHGELSYSVQETFSLMGAVTATQFNNLSAGNQAWGLIPFEITGSALWKPLKDVQVNATIFYKEGSLYRINPTQSGRLLPAVDMNLGGSFSLKKNLNLWLQMNNLFNNMYQRWNQYPVFGFNVMAGVVYSFK